MGANKTANARDARLLNFEIIEFTHAELGAGLIEAIDMRGFTQLTAVWSTGSSCHSARISRAMSGTASAHISTGNLDIMVAAGSSGGSVNSTSIDWPWAFLTATTSGSTGTLRIGMR